LEGQIFSIFQQPASITPLSAWKTYGARTEVPQ